MKSGDAVREVLVAWQRLGLRHAVAALAVALALAVPGLRYLLVVGWPFLPAFVFDLLTTGVMLVLAIIAADRLVDTGAPRFATYAAAIAMLAIVSRLISWHVAYAMGWRNWFSPETPLRVQQTQMLFGTVSLMINVGLGTAAYARWRERRATARQLHASEVRRAQDMRRLQEIRLRTLQARVDPQFLFDVLKRVGTLQRSDAAAADALLNDLVALLREMMPSEAAGASTVAREFSLALSYLRVVASAITALTIEVSVSPEAGDARLAPMLLVPLLDAALAAHPREMPRLKLRADAVRGRLRIMLAASPSGDISLPVDSAELARLRDRLAELYGANGALRIEPGAGLTVTLELPLERT